MDSANRTIVNVEYVNLAGVRSSRPWNGVNIKVTQYDDTITPSSPSFLDFPLTASISKEIERRKEKISLPLQYL